MLIFVLLVILKKKIYSVFNLLLCKRLYFSLLQVLCTPISDSKQTSCLLDIEIMAIATKRANEIQSKVMILLSDENESHV